VCVNDALVEAFRRGEFDYKNSPTLGLWEESHAILTFDISYLQLFSPPYPEAEKISSAV